MNETNPKPGTADPWSDFLLALSRSHGATITDNRVDFGSADAQTEILEQGAALVPLGTWGEICAEGEDSASFLHNLFSNDVQHLSPEGVQWNSFNSPKGRMLASFLVWREPDSHRLLLSADVLPAFLKKLSMYVLRSKVKLRDSSQERLRLGLCGIHAEQTLRAANLPTPAPGQHTDHQSLRIMCLDERNFLLNCAPSQAETWFARLANAGAQPAAIASWDLSLIRAGLPQITLPTQDAFVAQMLNYELIGGVSFKKGCYPGQEIIARTKYLGKVKKRLYRVSGSSTEGAVPASDLYAPVFGEQSSGALVNVARLACGGFEALAVLQTAAAAAAEIHLARPDGPRLNLLPLPYAVPEALPEPADECASGDQPDSTRKP